MGRTLPRKTMRPFRVARARTEPITLDFGVDVDAALHQQVRREWGFGKDEALTHADLIEEKYRGIRPAAGYPACPDHTEKGTLWKLLEVEEAVGIRLTESYAMWPAASVSGLYFSHPQARYFAVDMITKDQVENYAARKGMPLGQVERWLAPNLAYDVE